MLPSQKQIDFVQDIAAFLNVKLPNLTDRREVVSFINRYKYEYYKKRDERIKEKIIEEISIESFAQEIGMQLVRKGRYFAVKGHENSIRIDPVRKRFWHNSRLGEGGAIGEGGDVIDFAKEFANMDTHEAFTYFTRRVLESPIQGPARERKMFQDKPAEKQAEKKVLQLPQKDQNMRRVYAYLTKSRMIAKEVVQYFVDQNMLYQDTYGNCVFVGYDDKMVPVYGFLRGTHTERRFLGDCQGSDYEYGFYINNHADKLIVAESVIDGMSIMSILLKQGKNFLNYNYIFLCSACKLECLIKHIKSDVRTIYIAVDHDKAGCSSKEAIKKMLQENHVCIEIKERLPQKEEMDWNEAYQEALIEGNINKIRW